MKTMQITFENDLHRRVKHLAIDTGMTLANVVRTAVLAYVTSEEKQSPVQGQPGLPVGTVAATPEVVIDEHPIVASVTIPAPAPMPDPEPIKPEQVPDPNQICHHRGYGA